MKKTYYQPQIEVMVMQVTQIICGSDDIHSDKGIGYGGKDDAGSKDPASRYYKYDDWDDEEE